MKEKEFEYLLEKAKQISDYRHEDVSAAWGSFSRKINSSSDIAESKRLVPLKWIAVAASFLIVVLFSLKNDRPQEGYGITISQNLAEKFTLPDGSEVILEPNSKLFHPSSFDQMNSRTVFLDGNANFDVASMKDKPFIVKHDDFNVRVLGTQFLIEKVEDNKVLIENIEGSVRVTDNEDETNSKVLNAGDKMYFSKKKFISPEVEIKEVSTIASQSFYKIYEHLYTRTEGRTYLHINGKMSGKSTIDIDLNQSISKIMMDLNEKSNILFDKGNCKDCYIIYQLLEKN